MASYFKDKLLDLLPPVYREKDSTGDLRTFLQVPSETLDEIKALIDRMTSLFDIDTCEARFLPHIGAIVGCEYDPTRDPESQRREIKESVDRYRRNGTKESIRRSLERAGWRGNVDETYRSRLRLNSKGVLNVQKLPGKIYSMGVYQVECRNLIEGLRHALASEHPAGAKAYFKQWMNALLYSGDEILAYIAEIITTTIFAEPRHAFGLNKTALNSYMPLTRRETSWAYWRITDQVFAAHDLGGAGIRVDRWMGISANGKLNGLQLNEGKLADVDSASCLHLSCANFDVGTRGIEAKSTMRLCRSHLSKYRLARNIPCCEFQNI